MVIKSVRILDEYTRMYWLDIILTIGQANAVKCSRKRVFFVIVYV